LKEEPPQLETVSIEIEELRYFTSEEESEDEDKSENPSGTQKGAASIADSRSAGKGDKTS